MRHDRLPPIFTEFSRFMKSQSSELKKREIALEEVIPRIVINVSYNSVRKESKKIRITEIDFYTNFWIEFDGNRAFLCHFDPDTLMLRVAEISENSKIQAHYEFSISPRTVLDTDKPFTETDKIRNVVMVTLALMTMHKQGIKTSTFTAMRNNASVYYAEGDSIVFKRIHNLKKLPSPEYAPPEPGSSGIRKKEHDVIGHYRQYKSGVKVFVRPHKRGDPSLGRVTSVFT